MIRVFFAPPGAGKSTECCHLAAKFAKKYKHRFINFPNTVPGCGSADLKGLGLWTFPTNSYIAVDEAGIEYNSRKTLKLPQYTIKWLKKHRHYGCDLDFFSQDHEDMDITIRRLATEYWMIYRFGPWSLCRRIYKRIGIDKNTHQIINEYRFASMLWLFVWPLQLGYPFQKKFTLTFRPFYYKYFDSWETDDIPIKDFPVHSPAKQKQRRKRAGVLDTPGNAVAVDVENCFERDKK